MSDFSSNPWRAASAGNRDSAEQTKKISQTPTAESFYQAAIEAQNNRQYQSAVENARKAVELNPIYLDAWFTLGFNLIDLEGYAEAIQAFQKALDIEKDGTYYKPYSLYNIGLCYYRQSQDDEALPYFQRSIEVKPDYVPAINYVDRKSVV